MPFKTEPRHESGLLSDNVSIYNLLNKLQNVNNNDTKFSLDVNFSYNELIKKPYIKKAMLIGIVKNSVNEPFVVSFIVNKHTNEIQSIDVLYAVNTKNKGNNDDTANAKALASTSETSVGNVPFNSSISKYSDNVKKFSLDVGRFSNDLRNTQLWQFDGYEHFFKAKELYQQKNDMLNCHAK